MIQSPVRSDSRESPTARQRLFDRLAVDTRALAVVRIGLAAIVLVEWIADPPGVASGLVEVARWATLPAASALLLGYRTRLATVLTWIAYGIPVRADLLTPGTPVHLGRYSLVLLLFWSMFLPNGDHFSYDSRRDGGRPPRFVLSVASAGLLIQFFVMYFWAGATKNVGEWLVERTALADVLAHPDHGSSLGQAVLDFPQLLGLASVATVIIEVVGSVLLFVPHRGITRRRIYLVGVFIAFHVGMAAFMTLQFFPYVMMVGWLVFLPPAFWDRMWGGQPEAHVDTHKARSLLAGTALGYVLVSSVITWLYFPAREGFPAVLQEIGRHILLYQQWAMFSVPSTL